MQLVQAPHICCISSREQLHAAEPESIECKVASSRLWLRTVFPNSWRNRKKEGKSTKFSCFCASKQLIQFPFSYFEIFQKLQSRNTAAEALQIFFCFNFVSEFEHLTPLLPSFVGRIENAELSNQTINCKDQNQSGKFGHFSSSSPYNFLGAANMLKSASLQCLKYLTGPFYSL